MAADLAQPAEICDQCSRLWFQLATVALSWVRRIVHDMPTAPIRPRNGGTGAAAMVMV